MGQRTTVVLFLITAIAPFLLYAEGPAPLRAGQQGTDSQIGQANQDFPKPDPDLEKKMAKARLEDRYRNLKKDTTKLLELATELKQYVDKSNQDVLSLEVIKKCDQIEKLAKNVRSNMKGE
jgi:hypothetical protein